MIILRIKRLLAGKERKKTREQIKRAKNLKPAFAVSAEEYKSLIDHEFITSKDPAGKPWKSLAASTLEQKRRLGYSEKPLIRRGARGLQGKITVKAAKDGIKFGFGKLTPYGSYHQFGTSKVPQRRILPFIGPPNDLGLDTSTPQLKKIYEDMAKRALKYILTGDPNA